jgi:serine phosphatase RsbU (regulator of sigma subunit)
VPAPAPAISARELDQARLDLLRQRIATFGLLLGAAIVVVAVLTIVLARGLELPVRRPQLAAAGLSVLAGIGVMVMPRIRRERFGRASLTWLIRRTQLLTVVAALSQISGAELLGQVLRILGVKAGVLGPEAAIGPALPVFAIFGVTHTIASLIVPWRVRDAMLPVGLLALLATIASAAAPQDSWAFVAIGAIICLLAGLPGLIVTALRSGGVNELLALRTIGGRYAEVEQELSIARRIHERLFPAPIEDGPLRLAYAYAPMRQIGGDYLDAVRLPDGTLVLAVIDVTGHGVAAALAVNRLHGELKRVLASGESATHDRSPASVARALNDYVRLTLADERVFATAIFACITPDGRATLCNAGHPPPMVVRPGIGGGPARVESLERTSMMLGVFEPEVFEAEEHVVELAPGETLVLYTDGASEAMDGRGRQLGTEGLRAATAGALAPSGPSPAGGTIVEAITGVVNAHRAGPPDDDTLVVAVTRKPRD